MKVATKSGYSAILVGLLLSAGGAIGQSAVLTPALTDSDLRSLYCIPVTQAALDYADTLLTMAEPGEAGAKVTAVLRQEIAVRTSNLKRLNAYVLPKMAGLVDAQSIGGISSAAAATNRGKADARRVQEMSMTCMATCDKAIDREQLTQCIASCDTDTGATGRVNACGLVNWLPL